MDFSKLLIAWYIVNKRALPWRETKDPYAIWLSEIILQQTRVNQGLPYYLAFLEQFPKLQDLAHASEQEVLKLWQGLGYYSRARNLQKTARYITNELQGNFPTSFDSLQTLPGVGPYTAAAIASFAFDQRVPAIDGNVFRVAARVFGLTDDTALAKTRTIFWEKLLPLIPPQQAADFNQAMMEFGATVCLPKNPSCTDCIFQRDCVAYQTNQIAQLPVKSKKIKVSKRYLHYFWVRDSRGFYQMQQREGKGIWQNLYELPVFYGEDTIAEPALEFAQGQWQKPAIEVYEKEVVHQLSHQQLIIRFYKVDLPYLNTLAYSPEQVLEFPVPIVLHNFISEQLSLSKN